MPPILNRPPVWKKPRSRFIWLYHGCTTDDKTKIERVGIKVSAGRIDADFGRGFYTTAIKHQAQHWASVQWQQKYNGNPNFKPVILKFRIGRHELAKLTSLVFVVGDYNNNDYWSLVHHCRKSSPHSIHDHDGPVSDGKNNWYDVVSGPVSAFWQQRSAMADSDQISFHTDKGEVLLQTLVNSRIKGTKRNYDWEVVGP